MLFLCAFKNSPFLGHSMTALNLYELCTYILKIVILSSTHLKISAFKKSHGIIAEMKKYEISLFPVPLLNEHIGSA